jgi:hypothetical protein
MMTVSAWWRRRSRTALAMELSLLKMLAHCLKGLLVVTITEPRSYRDGVSPGNWYFFITCHHRKRRQWETMLALPMAKRLAIQQLLPKLRASQTPPKPHRLELLPLPPTASPLHLLQQPAPPRLAIPATGVVD